MNPMKLFQSSQFDRLPAAWRLAFLLILSCLGAWLANIPIHRLNRLLPFCLIVVFLWFSARKLEGFFQRHWYALTIGGMSFPFFCLLYGTLGFLIGISLTRWHGLLALVTTVTILWHIKKDWKDFWINLGLVTGLILGCLVISSFHFDWRDGVCYHKPSVIFLAKGWNPVWGGEVNEFTSSLGISTEEYRLGHTAYFLKGKEIITAVIYLMTGNIDAGDFVNLLMIFLAFLSVWGILRSNEIVSPVSGFWIALVSALNPISIVQVNSGYLDGLLYSEFTILLFSLLGWFKTGKKEILPVVIMSVILVSSLKFTAPVYLVVTFILFTVPVVAHKWILDWHGPTVRTWFAFSGCAVLGALLVSVHPLLTNTYYHTSPFYPIHSFQPEKHPTDDILGCCYVSPDFIKANRFQKFVFSYLTGETAYPDDISEDFFPVHISRIGTFSTDLKDFGFTCYFPICLAISLALLFLLKGWDNWLFVLVLLVTVFIQPELWWNRFVPQLWLVPLVVLAGLARTYSTSVIGKEIRGMCGFVLFLLLTISLGMLYSKAVQTFTEVKIQGQMLRTISQNPGGTMVICCPGDAGFDETTRISFFEYTTYARQKMSEYHTDLPIDAVTGESARKLLPYGICYSQYFLYCEPGADPKLRTYEEIGLEVQEKSMRETVGMTVDVLKLRARQVVFAWNGNDVSSTQKTNHLPVTP